MDLLSSAGDVSSSDDDDEAGDPGPVPSKKGLGRRVGKRSMRNFRGQFSHDIDQVLGCFLECIHEAAALGEDSLALRFEISKVTCVFVETARHKVLATPWYDSSRLNLWCLSTSRLERAILHDLRSMGFSVDVEYKNSVRTFKIDLWQALGGGTGEGERGGGSTDWCLRRLVTVCEQMTRQSGHPQRKVNVAGI